ncbi:ABC transporter ATP-binding protein [Nocardioides bruguierae]|uniref:ABC transporter ATP-binding protein n=1 Tax=Nocardioides bruguierae TaxID=2945102 RepID=UPI002021D8CB|nr:ABC transporter ATP-binding protein [Nocardioides bruguierae]MCL8026977.1 ABC transporter ATP-binding protein [Nocardioides bruguierae]
MLADVVVKVRDLAVSRGGVPVLGGIDLEIAAAETVAISGPSGSGKSTLLGALAGLVKPHDGEIWIAGVRQEPSDRRWAATRLREIGIVFQSDEFLPELTLTENVCLPSMLGDRSTRVADYAEAADELLARLGVEGLGARRPSEVSVGQLQRAAVARAVLGRPSIILADEPTSALDQAAARDALGLLLGLAKEEGAAVCIVTHDPAVAALCDRRLLLQDGQLVPVQHAQPAAHA